MNNNSWTKIKSDYKEVVGKIDILVKNGDDDEKEFWKDAKNQLQEAKKEAEQKVEMLERGTGEATEYAQQEFEDIFNDLNNMLLFIKESFSLGEDNETGS
ncbi:MAG: hypothetical protein WCV92_04580 [Candidatus Buchananbacteria bacterium]